jgi:AhpD family alkylhydroperoxidase
MAEENPFEVFQRECPELAARLDDLIEAQQHLKGLDGKTRQLINLAIQTANRNPRGVFFHAVMARNEGATRDEVKVAVVMNLHLSGLAPVLECLPTALSGYDGATGRPA